jgi:hypothetical protein
MDRRGKKKKKAVSATPRSERSDLKAKSRDPLGRDEASARIAAPGRGANHRGAPAKPRGTGRPD